MKRWEEAGGRREKSRLCFISALHSFFTRKREFEAEKAAYCSDMYEKDKKNDKLFFNAPLAIFVSSS